jgi:hypothetical protein
MLRRLIVALAAVAILNLAVAGTTLAAHPFDGATPFGNPQDALLGPGGLDPCDGDHSGRSGITFDYPDLDFFGLGPASLGLVAHAAGVGH